MCKLIMAPEGMEDPNGARQVPVEMRPETRLVGDATRLRRLTHLAHLFAIAGKKSSLRLKANICHYYHNHRLALCCSRPILPVWQLHSQLTTHPAQDKDWLDLPSSLPVQPRKSCPPILTCSLAR
jgi:hypothetical protein